MEIKYQKLKSFYVMHFIFQVFAVEMFLLNGHIWKILSLNKLKYPLPYLKYFNLFICCLCDY